MSILSENFVNIGQAQQLVAGSILTEQIPQKPNVAYAIYNFALIGGSVSLDPYVLPLSKPIPQGSAITRVSIVPSGIAGVGYNYDLGLNTTIDVVNGGVLTGNSFLSTEIRAAADITEVQFSINAAPITAGSAKFQFIYL